MWVGKSGGWGKERERGKGEGEGERVSVQTDQGCRGLGVTRRGRQQVLGHVQLEQRTIVGLG